MITKKIVQNVGVIVNYRRKEIFLSILFYILEENELIFISIENRMKIIFSP